jgi:hypothetical protein
MGKKQEKNITLELKLEEVNTVLEALAKEPFMNVYKLIEKIHVQARSVSENKSGKGK